MLVLRNSLTATTDLIVTLVKFLLLIFIGLPLMLAAFLLDVFMRAIGKPAETTDYSIE